MTVFFRWLFGFVFRSWGRSTSSYDIDQAGVQLDVAPAAAPSRHDETNLWIKSLTLMPSGGPACTMEVEKLWSSSAVVDLPRSLSNDGWLQATSVLAAHRDDRPDVILTIAQDLVRLGIPMQIDVHRAIHVHGETRHYDSVLAIRVIPSNAD